jgi:hypothetical protein
MIIQVADDCGRQTAQVHDEASLTRTRLKNRKKDLPVAARAQINDMCDLPDMTLLRLVAAVSGKASPRFLKPVKVLARPRKSSWRSRHDAREGPPVPAWIRHEMDIRRSQARDFRRAAAGFRKRKQQVELSKFDLEKEAEIKAEQEMFAAIKPLDWGV